jgi:hypothetical protein
MKNNLTRFLMLMTAINFSQLSLADSPQLVWFGKLEVQNGALKSATGVDPRAGSTATLRVFKRELSWRVFTASYQGGEGIHGYVPHVFIRYNDGDQWREYTLRKPEYFVRGVYFEWEEFEDVALQIPHDADRIEAWIKYDRVVPGDCYLGYDIWECANLYPSRIPAYISNYGSNFKIPVQ